MNADRYNLISKTAEPLTPEEIAAGWHFCCEFDGLLVGPGSSELNHCSCLPKDHAVYAELEACDHDWKTVDASFDHEFGTERVFYNECQKCGLTGMATPNARYDDDII